MNRFMTLTRDILVVASLLFPIADLAGHDSLNLSEETLACNDLVNVSANATCGIELDPTDLLEGEDPLGTYELEIFSTPGFPIDQSDVSNYIGRQLTYNVTDLSSGVTCWGHIIIENKVAPEVACATCNDPEVTDPDCILNCAQLPLFTQFDPITGKRGYDINLLDQIIPSDPNTFISDNVSLNCGQPVSVTFVDGSNPIPGSRSVLFTRRWTIQYDGAGGPSQVQCSQYYRFDPIGITDDEGNPILIEGDGTPIEDVIIMPQKNILIPLCNSGASPAEIAAFYDDPMTVDRDSDDDGLDPDEFDIDCVIESNEGIWRAYPHYYLHGIRPSGLHAQPLLDEVCSLRALYSDVVFDACAMDCVGNSKISRSWSIIDWAKNEFLEYNQVIDAIDNNGPTYTVKDINASVVAGNCTADVLVPQPEHLIDDCDPNASYRVVIPASIYAIEGSAESGFVVKGLPVGIYNLLYIAEDCCGNINETGVKLEVSDLTPPIVVLTRNLVVDLVPSGIINEPDRGIARVHARDIDNGSFDGCSTVEIAIRRPFSCTPQDTIWGEAVEFCCNDLVDVNAKVIDIEFRATDLKGNQNFGLATVTLEDKGVGTVCAPDMALGCDQDVFNYDLTGIPQLLTSCENLPLAIDTLDTNERTEPRRKRANEGNVPGYIGVEVPAFDRGCGFGAIRRQWRVGGNTICEQWFVIEPSGEAFDPSTIVFPEDVRVECPDFKSTEPTWQSATCNLIALSLDSDTLTFLPDACVKILNEWSIIDWCVYDPTDSDLNNIAEPSDTGEVEGRYTHTQVISVDDNTHPALTTDSDIVFSVDGTCLSKGLTFTAVGLDEGRCPTPLLGWTANVDLENDGVIDYEYSTLAPIFTANGDPNPFYLARTINGEPVSFILPDGIAASKRRHKVDWILRDGCNNQTTTETYFTVEDNSPPTPYCLNLGTTVMENGEVELWAIDFNVGSFDQCSEDENLFFTFTDVPPPPRCDAEFDSRTDRMWYDGSFWFFDSSQPFVDVNNDCPLNGEGKYSDGGFSSSSGIFEEYGGDIHIWRPEARTSGRVFTTNDVDAEGFLEIPIYAWDECGNTDFCLVVIRVLDNGGGTSGLVAGVIMTEEGETVENVSTQIVSDLPDYPRSQVTDKSGTYAFNNNLLEIDYTIEARKDDDHTNGINTVDIIKIQRHILGLEPLDSPAKLIAADVNVDNKINGVDLIELRKLILGIYTELPQSDSWTILDAKSDMILENPWSYSEVINIFNMTENMMDQDFLAVKIGDVDNTAVANSKSSSTSKKQPISLNFDDVLMEVGQEATIEMNIGEALEGIQFAMTVEDATIVGITGRDITPLNFNIEGNEIRASINEIKSTDFSFELVILPNTPGLVSDKIALKSESIENEAYIGETLDSREIVFNSDNNGFEVSQNEPNPFKNITRINYTLPTAGVVKFNIMTIDGRLMERRILNGEAGLNNVIIDNHELPEGILYYTLDFNGHQSIHKMIKTR